eukprot:1137638-Pelagomonas_calceolata.AAC.3
MGDGRGGLGGKREAATIRAATSAAVARRIFCKQLQRWSPGFKISTFIKDATTAGRCQAGNKKMQAVAWREILKVWAGILKAAH